MLAKALAHWITTGLPLVIATPLLGLFLNLEPVAIGAVALTLLAGTPALTCIGLVGAALSVALRRGGLLLPVLVLPLTVPVLIFGVAASNAAITGPARLRRAVHDPVRADAWQPRARTVRRRRGAAAGLECDALARC